MRVVLLHVALGVIIVADGTLLLANIGITNVQLYGGHMISAEKYLANR